MVARPEVKFDLNVEILNSKTTFALLKFSSRHLLARITMGSTALRFRPLTFCDLCAKYSCIQVMFSCLNISLHIHCMLNLTSADSYTPVPCSLTCANAWMIHFPHVCSQNELCPSAWCSCSLCLICTDPKSDPRWQMTTADLQVKSCSQPFLSLPTDQTAVRCKEPWSLVFFSVTQASASGTVTPHLCSNPKQQIRLVP